MAPLPVSCALVARLRHSRARPLARANATRPLRHEVYRTGPLSPRAGRRPDRLDVVDPRSDLISGSSYVAVEWRAIGQRLMDSAPRRGPQSPRCRTMPPRGLLASMTWQASIRLAQVDRPPAKSKPTDPPTEARPHRPRHPRHPRIPAHASNSHRPNKTVNVNRDKRNGLPCPSSRFTFTALSFPLSRTSFSSASACGAL